MVIFLEYQNIKIFLEKVTLQISRKKWGNLNGEKTVGTFYKKEFQETNKKLRIEKVIKKKGDMLKVKG